MKIEEIEELIADTTPGRWEEDIVYNYYPNGESKEAYARSPITIRIGEVDANARFIAASRILMPKLIGVAKAAERLIGKENIGKTIDIDIVWEGAISAIMNGKDLIKLRNALIELEK